MRIPSLTVAAAGSVLLAACATPPAVTPTGGPHLTVPVEVPAAPLTPGERWTSDWLAAPFPFHELLPSWNVDVPEGTAFRVEVQVAAEGPESASPWLDLGGWGPWPEAERGATELEGGRVATDIVELEEPRNRWRWRILTRGAEGREAPRVRRFHACFSNREQLQNLAAGPEPEADRIRLALRRQHDEATKLAPRICSPTSVAMVLAYRGKGRPTAEVAALCFDAEHNIYGNWNRAVQGAWLLGVPGYLTRVATWTEAARFVADGQPLVISIGVKKGQLTGAPYTETSGHLVVLCGFDGEGRAIVMDPAVPVGDEEPRLYALAELETVWLRRGGFAYVLGADEVAAPSKR